MENETRLAEPGRAPEARWLLRAGTSELGEAEEPDAGEEQRDRLVGRAERQQVLKHREDERLAPKVQRFPCLKVQAVREIAERREIVGGGEVID
jgi:hypothetical protein